METIKLDNDKKLFFKDFELTSLLEFTQSINVNKSEQDLLRIYKFTIQSHLNIKNGVLFWVKDKELEEKINFGYYSSTLKDKISELKDIVFSNSEEVSELSLFENYQYLIRFVHKTKILAVLLVSFKNKEIAEESFSFFKILTNIVVIAIENKRLAREQAKQEAFNKELEIAKNVQQQLFPKNLPYNDKLKTYASYVPHDLIGGDYYDFIPINEKEYIFCIADVSGKGIPAALLMSNFQATLRTLVFYETDLKQMVTMLNKFVKINANGEKFITLFLGKFNSETNLLSYVNAGHNLPLLKCKTDLKYLEEGTTLLGVFDVLPFLNVGEHTVLPKTLLFLYTDGLSEIKNDSGVEIELDFLYDFAKKANELKEFHQYILDYCNEYKQNQSFIDDISLFSLYFE